MTNYNLQLLDMENPSKLFGDWLRVYRKQKYLTMEALAEKVGVSKQYISVLERAEPHALTGKPVTPTVEIVDAFAKALDRTQDEARELAGYAPQNPPTLPEPLKISDFEGFDKTDITDIKQYIDFKKSQKNKNL